MPQALGLLLFQVGAPIGLVNAVVGASLTGILSFGLTAANFALSLFGQRPQQLKPEDVQQSLRQATPVRMRYYGRNKHSGPWLFGASRSGSFHKVICLAHGELDAIEELWVDDNLVTTTDFLVNEDPYVQSSSQIGAPTSRCRIETRLGTPSQTAFSELVSKFSKYTEAHRGDGLALLYSEQLPVKQENYYETFSNGINTLYRVVSRGSKIKNAKTGVVEWGDNAASIIRDYMTHPDGMRLPESAFTTPLAAAGWAEAFDRADEQIELAAGGTENRYRIWGGYNLQERPADVLGRMLGVCDGRVIQTSDGGVTLDIGQYYEPTVIFTNENILDIQNVTRGVDGPQRPNTIRGTFTDPNADYTSNDATPWQDEEDATARGVESEDIPLLMSPSASQARRLMKLYYYRRNPAYSMTITVDKYGLHALSERHVRVQLDLGEIVIDEVFEVQDFKFNFGDRAILEGATLDLISLPEEARAWNAASEEGTAPVTDGIDEVSSIPMPSNVNATVEVQTIGGATVPYMRIEWDAAGSDALTPAPRIKKSADTSWTIISSQPEDTDALSAALEYDVAYDIEVRFKALSGSAGDWSETISVTPRVDETAPGTVSSLVSTGGVGEVDLAWNSPVSANYSRSKIYRNTVDNEGSATLVATVYGDANSAQSYTDNGLAAGAYYYWVIAANASGVESASAATGITAVS